jgi:hypothetical protein
MCKGRAANGPCTATHSGLLCFPFNLSHQQSCTSNEFQDLVRGDVEIVTRFHKILTQVTQSKSLITCQIKNFHLKIIGHGNPDNNLESHSKVVPVLN